MLTHDSTPRWRTEDIDEHVSNKVQDYEAAIQTLENEIRHLRDGVNLLEEENDRLKWELLSPRRRYMRPPVISFFGFQMDF